MNKETQIIVCVGAGGVGKTTVSGMLGLNAARKGQKVLVITIDPAKRLLDALGIEEMAHMPIRVDLRKFQISVGELYAFMPDLKREWMDFLLSSIKVSDALHKISENHFYRYMVDGLPGSLEIICSHILHRLVNENNYDVIILDTPPASNSVSFFDVPNKLIRVLEHSTFQFIIKQRHGVVSKLTRTFAFFSSGLLEKTLEKIIGSHFLSEVIDFALTIDAMYEPMLERARAMEALLKSPKTHFVLVARPSRASVNDSTNLQSLLKERGIFCRQLIMNQVFFYPRTEIALERKALARTKENIGKRTEKIVDVFEKECVYQQELISQLREVFKDSDCRILFLLKNSEHDLMTEMLSDYNQE